MTQSPILKILNLSDDDYLIKDINLEVYNGEFFSLLGPSGCGKTTLLRSIAGFIQPKNGDIIIDGVNYNDVPPNKRPVNMMFQSYGLFPHMNIYDNIAFGLVQDKLDKLYIKENVEIIIEALRISDFRNNNINDLSGGQQQRVALARCLAKKPKIILLDEPLGALDLKTTELMQIELLRIRDIFGITFIMVTHNQDEAMAMSNRIAVMNEGKILQIGTPEELYEDPDNIFVADFIGNINMLDGVISSYSNGLYKVFLRDIGIYIKIEDEDYFDIGSEVKLAIRPEEIYISTDYSIDHQIENSIEAVIIDIAFHGSFIVYHAKLSNDAVININKPASARSRKSNISKGNKVNIRWHISDGALLP